MLHSRGEGNLACRGLTNSGLNDISEENLFHLIWGDVVLVERVFQGNSAEFCRSDRFQGSVE